LRVQGVEGEQCEQGGEGAVLHGARIVHRHSTRSWGAGSIGRAFGSIHAGKCY
jgi:hypothetical protein